LAKKKPTKKKKKKPIKKSSKKKYKHGTKTIKYKEARAAFKKLSKRSQMFDVIRKSSKKTKTPTKKWAKDPRKSDVKGIDDGSPKAKRRYKKEIHDEFSTKGRNGAIIRHAKTHPSGYVRRLSRYYERSKVDLRNTKKRAEEKGTASYEAEYRVPELTARVRKNRKMLIEKYKQTPRKKK